MCISLFAGTFVTVAAAALIALQAGRDELARRVLHGRELDMVRQRERDVRVADPALGVRDDAGDAGATAAADADRERDGCVEMPTST